MLTKKTIKNRYLRDGRAPVPNTPTVSRVMSANKGKNTSLEVSLRKILFLEGLRGYRLHVKNLPGRPDIVFGRKKIVVLVNGCFWHRCPFCKLPIPKTHSKFWRKKFEVNVARDKKNIRELKINGWKVLIFWECRLKDNPKKLVAKLKQYYTKARR